MLKSLGNYYNNIWKKGSGKKITSHNPRDGNVFFHTSLLTSTETNECIIHSKEAFLKWSKTPYEQRKKIILKVKDMLVKHTNTLTTALCLDVGKTYIEASQEVQAMINKIDLSIQSHELRCTTETLPSTKGIIKESQHRAIGPIVVISPFNFPGHLPNAQIIPALLSGNSVILKPSLNTPYFSQEYAKLLSNCDFPKGVFNMVYLDDTLTRVITKHPIIKGIMFTGSSEVGVTILKQLNQFPEKLIMLEMGGNNPFIVSHHIKNIEKAAYITALSAFISSGQRCTCARRLIIQKNIYQPFMHYLIEYTKKLQYSIDQQDSHFLPPLISQSAVDSYHRCINDILSLKSATSLYKKTSVPNIGYFAPTSIIKIKKTIDKECFGPVLTVLTYDSFQNAIDIANDTQYGLGATLLTDDSEEIDIFKSSINCGVVNINTFSFGAAGNLPFGGIGKSGNYRPAGFLACDSTSYVQSVQHYQHIDMNSTIGGYCDTVF